MVGADQFSGQFNDAVGRPVGTVDGRRTLLGDLAGRRSGRLGTKIAAYAAIP
jgi:hypothetical protein